jgi:hypothetical protein
VDYDDCKRKEATEKDAMKERQSWSGENKINSYKMLSVMDHTGCFIYV